MEALLLGCQSWEHLRRARPRLRGAQPPAGEPRAALIVPCKGLDHELEDNLQALFVQDYANYRLLLVAESPHDPCCEVIRSLIARHPERRAKLVTAGLAEQGCQKVRNLQAAIAAADASVEVFAFVDSDARPRPSWLCDIVRRIDGKNVGVVTGYRWFVPERFTLANAILYSINATAASLLTPKAYQPVWGGSWAMRRDVFERIGLAAAWEGRLTDDLVATNAVRGAGLRVEFEPRCMIPSPLDATWSSMFDFLHRQYLIGRLYAPRWWLATLGATTLTVAGFWGGLATAIAGAVQRTPWALVPAAACAGICALNAARAAIRRELSRLYLPDFEHRLSDYNRFDAWAAPIAATVNWAAVVSSVFAQRMTWRGIEYQLTTDGKARVVRCVAGRIEDHGSSREEAGAAALAPDVAPASIPFAARGEAAAPGSAASPAPQSSRAA